ncbi:MAG: hypothetical protein JW832_10585 [Deltaproteobacteria bacterium]|nr:hypothetical protein [Deltaproteobacteria bacterium]
MHKLYLRLLMLLLLLSFQVAGIVGPAAQAMDLDYLRYLDPDLVTEGDLYDRAILLEDNYQAHHCVNGIIWQGRYADAADDAPTQYGTGGDSAIFTGFYLAGAVYRFVTTKATQDLDAVLEAARGLHILTHISGTPGVIARCAFPAAEPELWRYPASWQDRIDRGFIYESPAGIPDIGNPSMSYPAMIYYTRATRDQLTGILYGIGIGLAELDPAHYSGETAAAVQEVRDMLQAVIRSLWRRLTATGFMIIDHTGRTGTSAFLVTGLLKVQLLAVYRAALEQREGTGAAACKRIDRMYRCAFIRTFSLNDGDISALFNRRSLLDGYFSYNLRFARSFTVHLLEHDPRRKATVADYMEKHLWRYVQNHRNTHFSFLYAAATGDASRMDEALRSLRELSLKPLRDWSSPLHGIDFYPPRFVLLYGDVSDYVVPVHLRKPTEYFIWQKSPFDTGTGELDTEGLHAATGLDFILPYWMGRYYGFIGAPG